ncbi:Acyl dehydratase [Amycolatopsis marina]|uniref:Acyl dehydratase n=1 Tax=Amycolatopsis marina TaxID=490629 RepID=A0A1I1CSH8_9PSEU|nr:MaoC/PaaZ C-terminal domain-containing protein [Amycolatopsis marina]SFB63848.1 Acyl dehydratase [Amycolatopsis marina]
MSFVVEVGDELPGLSLAPISRATLALFAGGSGDHNPVHIDIDAARSAGAEDVFVHGMLTMAHAGRLLTDWVPQHRIRALRARFTAITPVHAEPACTGRVTAVEEVDGERRATVAISVTLRDGTTTLLGEAVIATD